MIIAIEGPSAVGRSTWCRAHGPQSWIEEAPQNIAAPDLYTDPLAVVEFWVKHNIARWQNALSIEREHGIVLSDGEPFNLRFSWSAWKAGEIGRALFDAEFPLYRRAVESHQIGFADIAFWMDAPLEVLRQRAAGDTSRRRKRYEMYLRLIPWMRAWMEAKNSVVPGSLREWSERIRIEDFRVGTISAWRYDRVVLDEMMEKLHREAPRPVREMMPKSRSGSK